MRYTPWPAAVLERVPSPLSDQFRMPTERYQYVPVGALPPPEPSLPQQVERPAPHAMLWRNGVFAWGGSDLPLQVWSLPRAQQILGNLFQQRLAALSREESDPLARLCRASAETQVLYVPPGVHAALDLESVQTGPGWAHQHLICIVGAGAHLEVIARHRAEGVSLGCLDLWVEERAHCTWWQHDLGPHAWIGHFIRAVQARDSQMSWSAATAGGVTVRWDGHVVLRGEQASASLQGLWALEGERQAHAHMVVDHQAPHTRSHQHFRGSAADQARSSFEGHILVQQLAQKTEAYQLNQNLLLSRTARAYSKPSLSVQADDVRATHGATTGKLDAEACHYLVSRGIPEERARELLLEAFIATLWDTFPERIRRCGLQLTAR